MPLHPAWRRRSDPDGVALLLNTLRLGGARGESAALRQAWETRADHPGLTGLIDFEGCGLWLARRLRQIGADNALASDLGGFVSRCAREIAASNLLVDAETETMLAFLAARGTPCILLKGAARRALAHLPQFGCTTRCHDAAPCQQLVKAEGAGAGAHGVHHAVPQQLGRGRNQGLDAKALDGGRRGPEAL
ncbi:MAG TPA: hypothetical protein VKD28_06545, partial [Gemmatimonadales bacterium]|nr:hypothetical protein [Gemmatimonadales bacterium]